MNITLTLAFIGAWIALTVTLLALVIRGLLRMNREPSLRMRPTAAAMDATAPDHGRMDSGGVPSSVVPPHGAPPIDAPARAARTRALIAVMAGCVALLVGFLINTLLPGLMFLPAALTPGLAAAATMATLAIPLPATPPATARQEHGTGNDVRVASLRAREPWTYAKAQVLTQPILAAVLLVAYLCLTMATASPDGQGRMRAITLDHGNGHGGTASPYPGAWYAVPLIAVTVLLLALTIMALRRIAHEPSAPHRAQADADRLWRVCLTRFATFLAVGTMLFYAAAVMAVAGSATWRVGTNGGAWGAAFMDDVYPTLGNLQMMAATVLGIAAIAYLVMAISALLHLWRRR